VSPEPTSDLTDLVLHVLAHVRVGGPGCVHDPRYVLWARGRAPPELERLVHEDAAVLGRAWSGGRMPAVVHAWPELLGSIAELRAIATQELRTLAPTQVRAPGVLAGLRALDEPAIELLHATLCALAPWYAGWRERELEPALLAAAQRARPWLDAAVGVLPSLASSRVELSWSLGPRGRGFPARIVVGAPAAWNDLDACIPAVLAMHEQSVIDGDHDDYARAEWAALTGLAARMGGAPAALRQAHGRWLASLELQPLLDALHAEGMVTVEQQTALLRDHDDRATRLAALAS
jgi:hypothetical protein